MKTEGVSLDLSVDNLVSVVNEGKLTWEQWGRRPILLRARKDKWGMSRQFFRGVAIKESEELERWLEEARRGKGW